MTTSHLLVTLALVATFLTETAHGYNQTLPSGNTTRVEVRQQSYGIHVFAISDKGLIVHQVSKGNLSDQGVWYEMPNPHQGSTPASDAQNYDTDPAIAQNDDGRLEIFIRSHISLDIWHYYQVDANDPWTWVGPREPACLCNFPPCKGQVRCGNNAQCGNDGYDCTAPGFENSGAKWWNTQAVFPTSDLSVSKVKDPKTGIGRIIAFYRGFDGQMYSVQQETAGNSTKYTAPDGYGTLLE